MTNYKLSGDNKGESLVVIYDEADPVTVPGTHPRFDEILTLLRSGTAEDDTVEVLVDTMGMMGKRLSVITDRVSVTPYAVYFDGDQLDGDLAATFVELYNEGKESALKAVANFLDKASQNASMDSVRALYAWIKNGDLVLKENGNFVAYKGVRKNADGSLESITHGKAWVDGVEYEGAIPNPLGAVVSMPRSSVNADGSVGCSVGLHAGTYKYASEFARGALLLVEINPRDVVSVPSDCTFQKLRVSKYTVLEHIEQRLETRMWSETAVDSYDGDEDYYDADDDEYYDDDLDDGDFTDDQPVDAEEDSSPKGKVWASMDEPDSNLVSEGDLWFKTMPDGTTHTPYFHTKNQWVEAQDEKIVPPKVDGSIASNKQLPTGSVTNNYVTNNYDVKIKTKTVKMDSTGALRGPDGKFLKGGKIKMERDERGHFIGKKDNESE